MKISKLCINFAFELTISQHFGQCIRIMGNILSLYAQCLGSRLTLTGIYCLGAHIKIKVTKRGKIDFFLKKTKTKDLHELFN